MTRQVSKENISFKVTGSSAHWDLFENNSWEPETFNILDSFLKPNNIMLDIGAWIGPISLYAASKIKLCYSFEPDPIAYQEFMANLNLNPSLKKKIVPLNMAITADGRKVKLFSRHLHGDSGSSILKRVKSTNIFISTSSTTIQQFLKANNIVKVDFIKMDVEGGEFTIIPRMLDYLKDHKPNLLVSLHPAALCEYYELKFLPVGFLRRIYRFIDSSQIIIGKVVRNKIMRMIKSLQFYNIYNSNLSILKIDNLKDHELMSLETLFFTK